MSLWRSPCRQEPPSFPSSMFNIRHTFLILGIELVWSDDAWERRKSQDLSGQSSLPEISGRFSAEPIFLASMVQNCSRLLLLESSIRDAQSIKIRVQMPLVWTKMGGKMNSRCWFLLGCSLYLISFQLSSMSRYVLEKNTLKCIVDLDFLHELEMNRGFVLSAEQECWLSDRADWWLATLPSRENRSYCLKISLSLSLICTCWSLSCAVRRSLDGTKPLTPPPTPSVPDEACSPHPTRGSSRIVSGPWPSTSPFSWLLKNTIADLQCLGYLSTVNDMYHWLNALQFAMA